MADRRMFHGAVVESDAFLDMPAGAQALYFHIGMHADDDGFVNGPRQIARKLRRPPRELNLLVEKGFLLDFDGIMVVKHWRMANSLKSDRLQLPRYPEIAEKIYLKESRAYTLKKEPGMQNLLALKKKLIKQYGIHKDSQKKREEKNREEKKREEKRIEEKNVEEKNPEAGIPNEVETTAADTYSSLNFMKGKLGKGVVLLTQEQVEQLLDKMGLDSFDYYVEKLADFILVKQAKVKNHYATIVKWWEEDRSVIE